MREYAGYARRVFIISLFLSLCIHFVAFFLIFRSFSGRDPEFHAFILLNLGEEAMELHVGGAADMAPASASVSARTEVPEEKFELERSEPETAEFRRIAPFLTIDDPKPEFLFAQLELPEPEKQDIVEERKPPVRKPKKKKREKSEPAQNAPELAASPASVRGGDSRPRGVRKGVEPLGGGFSVVYPESARLSGETGVTTVTASIGEDGICLSASIAVSSGYPALDLAAINAVQYALYRPATIDDKPVRSDEKFEIAFELID